jgi:hypothetical protein
MNTSIDLRMTYNAAGGPSFIFRQYITFAPTNGSTVLSSIDLLNDIVNSTTQTSFPAIRLGTLGNLEEGSWKQLYAKTKLVKVVIKYFPAVTMGLNQVTQTTGDVAPVANQFAQSAIMYTIPIYDNVDDIVYASGQIKTTSSKAELEDSLNKPYAKAHSIYKPWTRIMKPTNFMNYTTYGGQSIYNKRSGFIDLSNSDVTLNGLYIAAPPLTVGGLIPTTNPVASSYPGLGESFVLGRLQITYYQKFKMRE